MKSLFNIIIILLTICSFGCKRFAIDNYSNTDILPWETITITSESRVVVKIPSYNDTADVIKYHIGSFFSPRPKEIKTDTQKVIFLKLEKDSLYNLSKSIINYPVKTNECTEFIGHLKIVIDYGQFQQSCEYSSVCDWNNLTPETQKLHAILKRRLPQIYLGEHP